MVIRDKNNIFERVENFHADLAWNYPREILPGPCRVVLAIPFMQIIEVALASPPKRSSEYDWVLEFLPNIDVFPG